MTSYELLAAYLCDCLIGDPEKWPHPVRAMGKIIRWADRRLRPATPHPGLEALAGLLLAVVLPSAVYFLADTLLTFGRELGVWVVGLTTVYLAFSALAAGSLRREALSVHRPVQAGRWSEARERLARIVGRKTDGLDEPEIVRATVETVAENASDGVIAPLFYLLIGGIPLALAYKAVNTLDAMVGYRNSRYRYFGWASARLDDLANYIPSRLTALLLVGAAAALGENPREAWRILRRDGANDDSPNSGRPEAAMAGALGVRLGGRTLYAEGWLDKPTIGDPKEPLRAAVVIRAIRLMEGATLLMVLLTAFLLWIGER